MGLSEFPSFNSEAALRKELERQGYDVTQNNRGASRVEHRITKAFTSLHLSTVVHTGKRSKLALNRLVAIGFKPPAQYDREVKALKAEAKQEASITEPPAVEPAPETPDPSRAFACEDCAVARCRRCEDQASPCAFPQAMNLGRHRTVIHGAATKASKPRSSRVRVRTDPSVIREPFTRLAKQLHKQMEAVAETVGELMVLAAERDQELNELRRFKKEIEEQAGRFYDITTRPKH